MSELHARLNQFIGDLMAYDKEYFQNFRSMLLEVAEELRAPHGAGLTEEQDESIRVAAKTLDRLKGLVHISRLPAGAHAQSDINKGSIAAAKLRSVFPSVFAGN